ncbi:MAG TPA: 6-hydroxymethylpterin diphosphokinase MptE-like protein [Candidatus Didemnitutus sp.]|nr:6-hydroxymethylpterin diphosphokinase MptE-like protein [Candidatus Didemnitutus sp.]
MSTPGLAYSQPYPGSATCVLLGRAETPGDPDLRGHRAILWFVDGEGAVHPPSELLPGALLPAPLEHLDSSRVISLLEQFVARDARHLPSVFVTNDALARHTEAYQSVLTSVCSRLEDHHRIRTARQRFGFQWQRNVLANLPAYCRRRLPAAWRGALRGRAAFVCGSGPSLDRSAPALAPFSRHGIVIASDSALRTLAHAGITADFAVTIDATKSPDKCLPVGQHPRHVVASAVGDPAWVKAVPAGSLAFAASRQITTVWLGENGVSAPDFSEAENSGATAIELARHLGCSPIYLFGFDLAVDADDRSRSHSADTEPTLYAGATIDPNRHLPELPGNYTPSVPSHLSRGWRSIDTRLAGWPAGLVFNVTDRGAWLTNTTLLHPDNFAPSGDEADAPIELLAPPEPAPAAAVDLAFRRIRAVAERSVLALPALRAALEKGGPPALATEFRPHLADHTLGRVLGSFSLKIMPQLMPPLEGDTLFWQGLLDEYAALLEAAQRLQ